jgi:crossover junction endodeoxyribonuclease RusA
MWELKIQARSERVVGAYKLTILAVKPDKRKRDLGNLEKAVSDILVTMSIVEDDHLCEWLEIKWVPEGSACTVLIEPMRGNNETEALL